MSQHPEPPPAADPARPSVADRAIRAYSALLLALPYALRVRLAAQVARHVTARLAGTTRKIAREIAATLPGTDAAAARAMAFDVQTNIARTQIELLSGAEFQAHAAHSPLGGPGLQPVLDAQGRGQPVILLISHFGNAAAMSAALRARGLDAGSFYKPLPDPAMDRRYVTSLEAFTRPLFPNTREGLVAMLRHLRAGGMVTISFDLDREQGSDLSFLGRPTPTVLSMAEMALRHDALLVPAYGLRQPDGLTFQAHFDAPIPHGAPQDMMQAANDSLERMVRAHPRQWLWWHRRWKPPHRRKSRRG